MDYILLVSLSCAAFFCLSNCASDKKDLPNTPESVARQWQLWIDNNEYLLARELSTSNAIEWIDWVEETLKRDGLEVDTFPPTQFLHMRCTERGNLASCLYLLDDNGFQYQDSFYLKKINSQWLVDIPEQDLIEDDMIENLFKELQKQEEQVQ